MHPDAARPVCNDDIVTTIACAASRGALVSSFISMRTLFCATHTRHKALVDAALSRQDQDASVQAQPLE